MSVLLQLNMDEIFEVIAKIPYRSIETKNDATASEVATFANTSIPEIPPPILRVH